MARLIVGKERITVQELELPPGDAIVFIGRNENNDVCLPSLRISKRHASVQRRGGRIFITDLGSTNGTVVNGRPIEPYREVEIFDGDVVDLSPYLVHCRFPESPRPVPPSPEGIGSAKTVALPVPRGAAEPRRRTEELALSLSEKDLDADLFAGIESAEEEPPGGTAGPLPAGEDTLGGPGRKTKRPAKAGPHATPPSEAPPRGPEAPATKAVDAPPVYEPTRPVPPPPPRKAPRPTVVVPDVPRPHEEPLVRPAGGRKEPAPTLVVEPGATPPLSRAAGAEPFLSPGEEPRRGNGPILAAIAIVVAAAIGAGAIVYSLGRKSGEAGSRAPEKPAHGASGGVSPVPSTVGEERAAAEQPVPGELEKAPGPIAEKPPEPVAEKPPEAVAEKPPEPVAEKPPEAVSEKSPEPVAEKPREPVSEKSPEPVAEKSPEPVAEKPHEAVSEKPPEAVAEKPPEAVAEKPPEPVAEKPPEAVAEKPPEPVAEKPPEAVSEKSPEPAAREPFPGEVEKASGPVVEKPAASEVEPPHPPPPAEVPCERDPSLVLVRVPAGEWTIGDEDGEPDERPARKVFLDEFLIGKTEVTMAQYARFLAWIRKTGDHGAYCHPGEPAGKDHRPALDEPWARAFRWETESPPEGCADLPVVLVDWYDAYAYCRWAGGSLPSEAQWEKAASFDPEGKKRRFPWGDTYEPGRAQAADRVAGRPIPDLAAWQAWRKEWLAMEPAAQPRERLARAGSFPQGASALGILDLAGNVREWCLDEYAPDAYARGEAKNPVHLAAGPEGDERVNRGGDWSLFSAWLRTGYRNYNEPHVRSDAIGFRLCVPVK
jgi:formylglycine-generating enzyme required for sulfatase activity